MPTQETAEIDFSKPAFPLMLNRADALNFAAERMEELASHMSLGALLVKALSSRETENVELTARMRHLRDSLPNSELQMEVARDAARFFRELAVEERLSEARRMTADIGRKPGL